MSRPKELAMELSNLLTNGTPAMRFEELEAELGGEVIDKLPRVRKWLEHDHTPTILVTEYYFDLGDEPADRNEAWKCCALHGRLAAGIRLLFMVQNDLLGITWLKLNQTNSAGVQASNVDRIVVGHNIGKLPTGKAKKLVDDMGTPKLPFHEAEFAALMNKKKK
jgi:hypothetical protein